MIEFTCCTEGCAIDCLATVETQGQTGVEKEALTAAQIALLTIYDMCKSIDRGMTMTNIRLIKKDVGNQAIGEEIRNNIKKLPPNTDMYNRQAALAKGLLRKIANKSIIF